MSFDLRNTPIQLVFKAKSPNPKRPRKPHYVKTERSGRTAHPDPEVRPKSPGGPRVESSGVPKTKRERRMRSAKPGYRGGRSR